MPKPGATVDAEDFARRLVELLDRHGQPRRGAGAYLARRYHVSAVTANAWLNGEHKADIPTSKKIAEDHGVTFDELYFGEASKPRRIEPIHAYEIKAIEGEEGIDPSSEVLLPEVDMTLGAGPGQWVPEFVETKRRMPYQIDWLNRYGAKPEDVRVMRVRGASMERVLFDGDKVAVHFTFDNTNIRSGNVYAFALDGESVVKYVFRHGNGLRIVSENSDKDSYPDIIVPGEQLTERVAMFGQVIDKSGPGGLFR